MRKSISIRIARAIVIASGYPADTSPEPFLESKFGGAWGYRGGRYVRLN